MRNVTCSVFGPSFVSFSRSHWFGECVSGCMTFVQHLPTNKRHNIPVSHLRMQFNHPNCMNIQSVGAIYVKIAMVSMLVNVVHANVDGMCVYGSHRPRNSHRSALIYLSKFLCFVQFTLIKIIHVRLDVIFNFSLGNCGAAVPKICKSILIIARTTRYYISVAHLRWHWSFYAM